MDYTELTDEELDAARLAILTEQERRANLASIPAEVARLARTYTDGGGDPAILTAALEPKEPNE